MHLHRHAEHKYKYKTFVSRVRTTNVMIYRIDHELTYALADVYFSLTRRQHFVAWNDVTATILKIWCHIKKNFLSAFCLKNNPAKFHPDPLWNDGAFYEEVAPARTRRRWIAIWDQLVADLKIGSITVGIMECTLHCNKTITVNWLEL